jgi:hypothetical protein
MLDNVAQCCTMLHNVAQCCTMLHNVAQDDAGMLQILRATFCNIVQHLDDSRNFGGEIPETSFHFKNNKWASGSTIK